MTLCCNKFFSYAKEMNIKLLPNSFLSPPNKISYTIESNDANDKRGSCITSVKFIHDDYANVSYPNTEKECYVLKKCKNKKNLVLLYIANNSRKEKPTVIVSHGGSSDLGVIYPFLVDLSIQLKVKSKLI